MSPETEKNQGDIGDSEAETKACAADHKNGKGKAQKENLLT